ncbi:MAG: hypothetical protein ABSD97_08490 [Acidimicrobiales bacterium]
MRAWYEADEENQLALAGDIDGFRQAWEAFVTELSNSQGDKIVANAQGAAERRFLSEGYGEWVASFLRAAGASGSHGAADDCLASLTDWGFPLSTTRKVVIWHGSDDQNVPAFHGVWLRDHLPEAELRVLENEGHISVVGHLPEIVEALSGPFGSTSGS